DDSSSFYDDLKIIKGMGIDNKDLDSSIKSYNRKKTMKSVNKYLDKVSTQETLEKEFVSYLEKYENQYSIIQDSAMLVIIPLRNNESVEEEDFLTFLTSLEGMLEFLRDNKIEDFSEIEKYKETYRHLNEMSAYLISAYVFINNSYTERNQDLFEQGLESF